MVLSAQQKDCYTKFFKATDKDGSGCLSVQELRNVLIKELKVKCSDAEVIEMFRGCDTNNDGKITLDEFLAEMGKVNPKDLQKADFERTFEMIDKDKSGTLDAKEIKQLFVTCGHQVTDDQIKKIIQKVDTDGDGQINIKEFLKMF